MFCYKCGKQNAQDSIFCKHCGTSIRETTKTETAVNQEIVNAPVPTKKKKNVWGSILRIVAFIVAFGVGRALGLVYFLLMVAWFVGYYFAKWFIKNHSNSKFFSVVAWLNVISWLLPALGFATAGITYVFAQQKKRRRYTVLWIVAVILAISSALLGTYLNSNNSTGLSDFKASFERSFVDSCTKTGGTKDQQVCECMANVLINNYNEVQLTEAFAQYTATGKAPPALQVAESSCVSTSPSPSQ